MSEKLTTGKIGFHFEGEKISLGLGWKLIIEFCERSEEIVFFS